MPKYQLLPIPLKQGFANSGIKQRVPYQLPVADDDLNWLEGFTDAYQRPVIAENLGEKGGRYVRMGQINQILENVSQAILSVKQSLDNVSETIDKGIKVKVDKVVTNANNALTNRKVVWLQTLGNQNCAGLKNFQGININNYKTRGDAVANLEWCNGLPIWTQTADNRTLATGTNLTITQKNIQLIHSPTGYLHVGSRPSCGRYIINNLYALHSHNNADNYNSMVDSNISTFFLRKGDIFLYENAYGGCSAHSIIYFYLGS